MSSPLKRAKKRVKKKKGFYGHLVTYIAVNAFMFFMMFITGENDPQGWLLPMSGWGIGLAIHYFRVFGFPGTGIGGADWEEKEIEKELNREGYSREQFEEVDEEDADELELKELDEETEVIKRQWRDEDMV